MSKRKETHVFRCSDRTCKLVIQACKDHIKAEVIMSRYGWSSASDLEAFERWLEPILARYGNDPRPVVMPLPLTGQLAVIGGDEKQGTLAVFTPASS